MAKKNVTRKHRALVTKVSVDMTYHVVLDSSGGTTSPIPLVPSRLGMSIGSPLPGGTVSNPVKANGQAINDGAGTTVTVWVKDLWGHITFATVTGPDIAGNWSASFPSLAAGTYALAAQAQIDSQTASETITITVN